VLLPAQGDLFKKLIRSGGSLEEKYVAGEVILPLVLTLEHLHARGIYHRDIKPENIFFTKEGCAQDAGLCRQLLHQTAQQGPARACSQTDS
jgi:serine/threonine protein kinase